MKEGDIFQYKGITLKAVKDKRRTCSGCYFYENNIICTAKEIPNCENKLNLNTDSYIFVEVKN